MPTTSVPVDFSGKTPAALERQLLNAVREIAHSLARDLDVAAAVNNVMTAYNAALAALPA